MANDSSSRENRIKVREIEPLQIAGVQIYSARVSSDFRGTFTKFYEQNSERKKNFDPYLTSLVIASNNEAGMIRGLHFQAPPFEEDKVLICLQGMVFDVIVDLRRGSPTQGKWASVVLSAEEPQSLCLPKGIAHGYQTLTATSTMFYGLSSEFAQSSAHSLKYDDADLNVNWPLPVSQISVKDLSGVSLAEAFRLAAGIPNS